MARPADARIEALTAAAYTIPTDAPEADGTISWDSTTLVVAEVSGGGMQGMGYTYSHKAAAALAEDVLARAIIGLDGNDIPAAFAAMQREVRNIGRPGIAMAAISAVDTALWDLKSRLLGLPLATLLGTVRKEVPIYGSGGFTSYADERLAEQLGRWVEEDGCRWVKMKVGSEPERDVARVERARAAVGAAGLFVDANGALSAKQALAFAHAFAALGVSWFEEPVSSDDLSGLRLLRDEGPAGMDIAAGEYGYVPDDFRRLLESGAVDVLQADATRCGGISGFMAVGSLCEAFHTDLSAHTAPALHLPVACAVPRLRHQEWFHDHVRIEAMLFDGAPSAHEGVITPDLGRPGLGLDFKRADAERFAA